jgi:hypothetical protein
MAATYQCLLREESLPSAHLALPVLNFLTNKQPWRKLAVRQEPDGQGPAHLG